MRLLIPGATGWLGKWVLCEALKREYLVHVLVRDKSRVGVHSDRLMVYEASPADITARNMAMENCNAIIDTLNVSRKSDFPWVSLRTPKTFLSDTMSLILALAERHNIRSLLVTTAWGVGNSRQDFRGGLPGLLITVISVLLTNSMNFRRASCENPDWIGPLSGLSGTIIRPVGDHYQACWVVQWGRMINP